MPSVSGHLILGIKIDQYFWAPPESLVYVYFFSFALKKIKQLIIYLERFIHNSAINNERPPQEPSGPEASQVSPVRSLTNILASLKQIINILVANFHHIKYIAYLTINISQMEPLIMIKTPLWTK
jgi:hypothetical protein